MNLNDGIKLLRNYAEHGNEAAFRELVERYVDFVYSTAVRRVGGDASLAQDVTQRVFADLALKARTLRKLEFLGGWLHRHTGFVASNMVRSEQRRQVREQEAAQMNAISESPDSLWQQLEPLLDDTIEQLEPPDRQAILLRFFERRDFRSVGNALGISDDAAQKRVSRAIEKLRSLLVERGVTLSAVLLATLLAGRIINAAPAGLAAQAAKFALAGAVAAGGAGLVPVLAKLSQSMLFKIALCGAVVAGAAWLYLPQRGSKEVRQPPARPAASVVRTANASREASLISERSMSALVPATNDTDMASNVLVLHIVAADSGKPIPNVEINYWQWKSRRIPQGRSTQATRFGVCKVPVPDDIARLSIVSHRDGFADTLLDWDMAERAEQVPGEYTLKLERAVPIGGQVLDPDGHPVAGANVSFGNQGNPASETRPQTDNFGWPFWITTTTDSQGRWQINRIGADALRTVNGFANHPDFVGNFAGVRQHPEIETQLTAGTYVFNLSRGVVVKGVVVDANGQPVPNANILVGGPGEQGARRTESQNDGSFSVAACNPLDNLITADAKGYATTTIDTNLSDSLGPVRLVLRPGAILKLRVTDNNGNPIAHANVMLNPDRYNLDREHAEPVPVEVRFNKRTGPDGRLEWDNAPDTELNFIVGREDYMVNRDVMVHPDGTEHVVILQSALTISGTVTDATTGQPIRRFHVIAGFPEKAFSRSTHEFVEDPAKPNWSSFERDWKYFTGGKFQFSYGTPMVVGEPNPDYMFKFEANGYAPFVTRIVKATEGSVHFDVQLTPAATVEVTVVSPNRTVAIGTDIGLVSPGAGLKLRPGGFSTEGLGGFVSTGLLHTDNQGRFALPPDPSITMIVAANRQGYAQVTPAELAANPVIQLDPWGRVEGTFVINGKPCSNRIVSIGFGQGGGLETISCDWDAFESRTDDQGRFTIPMAPPGNHEMTMIAPTTNELGQVGAAIPSLQPVSIAPGTDTVITIDTANLDVPEFMLRKWGLGAN